MFVDNTAALAIAQDPKQHQKTKAIRLRYHHVRHEVANKTIRPTYQKTTELSADIMTKSLPRDQHEYLRAKALGHKDYLEGRAVRCMTHLGSEIMRRCPGTQTDDVTHSALKHSQSAHGDLKNPWVAGPGPIPRGSVKYSGLAPVLGGSHRSSRIHVYGPRGQ